MPFEVGDKVKFLNEKGGGVITKILPGQQVEVEDEHGFHVEIDQSEIVSESHSSLSERQIREKLNQFDLQADHSNSSPHVPKSRYVDLVKGYLMESRKYWTNKKKDFVEIDLHIEELTGHPKRMSDGQKLEFQLEHARECLDAAVQLRILHVVFIHGVGAGVLRHELRNWLGSLTYVSFENADYRRYGIGATAVKVLGTFS